MRAGDAEVVVAGAGPVGLMLAIELLRRGVGIRLVERRLAPSYYVKALGITPRTLEIWDQQGLLDEVLGAGLFFAGNTTLQNGVEIERQDFPRDVRAYGYGFLGLAQYDVERILRVRLAQLGGRIEWGTSLDALEDRGDRVIASLVGANGARARVECAHLVGCDGAHSTVRHALGLGYEGDALAMTFMLGDVRVDGPLERGRTYRALEIADGTMVNQVAAIPIPGDPRRYRLSMAAPLELWEEGADLSVPPSLELLQQAVARTLPPGSLLSDLRWASFYRISHRIVPSYGSGRCFLAGDAAHIHPPIGGQGMNTGLQDAFNLGWKLALASRGRAAPDLLASYDAERRPVGLEVVHRTSARMAKAISGEDRGESETQLREDSQLLVGYRESAWVHDARATARAEDPRAGDRAPAVTGLERDYVSAPTRLLELLRHPGHTGLFFADASTTLEEYRRFAATADLARDRHGDGFACYGIAAADARPLGLERFGWLRDPAGRYARALGCEPGSLDVIRPDGYLGLRADSADAATLQRYLERVLAG